MIIHVYISQIDYNLVITLLLAMLPTQNMNAHGSISINIYSVADISTDNLRTARLSKQL